MKIQITQQDGSQWEGYLLKEAQPSKKYIGWRCLHQAEGGLENPDHMPVIRPGLPNPIPVPMTSAVQWMSYKINAHNPAFTSKRWTGVYEYKTAFTNQNGFSDPEDPRANFVMGIDLNYPLPKLMKGIFCGGSFTTGKAGYRLMQALQQTFDTLRMAIFQPNTLENRTRKSAFRSVQSSVKELVTSNNVLIVTPGVDAINAKEQITDTDAWAKIVIEKNWYFTATTRAGTKINNFPQGAGLPVYIPWILMQPTTYPLWWFERWEKEYLPDPLKIYNPV